VLLLTFHNGGSGQCNPSYAALQERTGYCRATIAKALQILEAMKVLTITRRLVRVRDVSVVLWCGPDQTSMASVS
jgi:hypothetical protein